MAISRRQHAPNRWTNLFHVWYCCEGMHWLTDPPRYRLMVAARRGYRMEMFSVRLEFCGIDRLSDVCRGFGDDGKLTSSHVSRNCSYTLQI